MPRRRTTGSLSYFFVWDEARAQHQGVGSLARSIECVPDVARVVLTVGVHRHQRVVPVPLRVLDRRLQRAAVAEVGEVRRGRDIERGENGPRSVRRSVVDDQDVEPGHGGVDPGHHVGDRVLFVVGWHGDQHTSRGSAVRTILPSCLVSA